MRLKSVTVVTRRRRPRTRITFTPREVQVLTHLAHALSYTDPQVASYRQLMLQSACICSEDQATVRPFAQKLWNLLNGFPQTFGDIGAEVPGDDGIHY